MDLDTELARRGGVARRATLLAAGATDRLLADAVGAGTLVRGRRGWYASARLPTAAATAFRLGGRLAATDAAESYGIWVLRSPFVHVWVPRNAARIRAPRGVRLHWDRAWSADEPLRVSLPHALAQLGRSADVEPLLVAVESALEKHLLSEDDIVLLRESAPRRVRRALDFARSDAQSGLETLARWRLHLVGVSARSQVFVPGVGRVDLLIGRSLIVELDGRSTHQFETDRRRDLNAVTGGFVTLRFSATQVLTDWPGVERAVLRAMAGGLHVL